MASYVAKSVVYRPLLWAANQYSATRVNYERKVLMNRKIFGIVLAMLVFLTIAGTVFAQVCVIRDVRITGWGTRTVVFENDSTTPQPVRVEVSWDEGKFSREFGMTIPAATFEGRGNNRRLVPGRDYWTAPGIISNIRECF